jgi:hypothetical protein
MDIITFINSLTNEDLNRIRNSKSDAEARRLLREHQALQLQQTGVMPCFSGEEIERINKYARHQYNRGQLDLSLVSFEEWVNKA